MGLGALFSGISGIVGMGADSVQNQKAMNFNREEAEKNRQFQKQMYEQQVMDNIDFWKMQNEYNDPKNQVARLAKAGINPSLALSNISTGQASSIQSGTSGSGGQATAPSQHSLASGFSSMASAINQLRATEKTNQVQDAQIENIAADSMLKRLSGMTQVQKDLSEIYKNAQGGLKDNAQGLLYKAQRETEDMLRGQQKEMMEKQINKLDLEGAILSVNKSYLDEEKKISIAQGWQILRNLRKEGQISDKQVEYMAKQIITEEAKGLSQKQQNELYEASKGFLLGKAYIESQPTSAQHQAILLGNELGRDENYVTRLLQMSKDDWKNLPYKGYRKPWSTD